MSHHGNNFVKIENHLLQCEECKNRINHNYLSIISSGLLTTPSYHTHWSCALITPPLPTSLAWRVCQKMILSEIDLVKICHLSQSIFDTYTHLHPPCLVKTTHLAAVVSIVHYWCSRSSVDNNTSQPLHLVHSRPLIYILTSL